LPPSAAIRPATPSPTWPGRLIAPPASFGRRPHRPAQRRRAGTGARGEYLRRHEDARSALAALGRKPAPELVPALEWALAAEQARLSVLSGLPADTVEELFATPLAGAAEVQRLLAGQSCLVIEDAHKALAVLK